jgi:GNAT superfamily N-acetyltransferase
MRWTGPGAAADAGASATGKPGLKLIAGDTERAASFILENLKEFNDSHSTYHHLARQPGASQPIAIMLTDDAGQWHGGICGHVHWGWLDVDDLWVAEEYRGGGHGRALLLALEQEAARRGATRAQLSTFHFQARGLYEKLGYRVIGELIDFPPGGAMYWMRKDGLRHPAT